MLQLNNTVQVVKEKKRRGRGGARGGTSGRGHKGQRARSGGGVRVLFEGGQMPLFRRLPKRGFNNVAFQVIYEIVNIGDIDARFSEGDVVDRASLLEKGLIKKDRNARIKILGGGTLSKQLTVEADAFSSSAIAVIEHYKGKVQVVTKER